MADRYSCIAALDAAGQAHNQREGTAVDSDPVSDGGWVTKDDRDLIEKTVEDFRLQRLSMVQSLRQFVLCYESILEWLVEQYPRSA
jgi:protein tyrosine phosphatase